MFKKIFLFLIFIISLTFSTLIVLYENSDDATSCPELESVSYCAVYDATPYIVFALSTIICIMSGYFLFRRRKGQNNSSGQYVKDAGQFYSLVIITSFGAGVSFALLLVLMLQI